MRLQLKLLLLWISSQSASSQASAGQPSDIPSALAIKLNQLHDLIYRDFVMFRNDVISGVECAHACLVHPRCVLFTFTDITGSWRGKEKGKGAGRCVGYRSFLATTNGSCLPLTETFVIKDRVDAGATVTSTWLYRSCTADSDCPVPMSQCFSGRCVCDPYLMYSVSRDSCVIICRSEDLERDVFLAYPVAHVQGLSPEFYEVGTREDCVGVCSHLSHCLAFEFDVVGYCYVYSSPSIDCDASFTVGGNWMVSSFNRMACR